MPAKPAVTLDEYRRLKKKVNERKAAADRAAGAYDAAMQRLKAAGYETVEEAQKGLDRLREQESAAEQEYKDELKRFEEKWGDLLGE